MQELLATPLQMTLGASGTPRLAEPAVLEFLRRNDHHYQTLVQHLLTLDPHAYPESALRSIQLAAAFAANHHCGRFADGAIENVALTIGEQLDSSARSDRDTHDFTAPTFMRDARRHILHAATTVLEVGGHTRTIANWIENDPNSRHSVLLVRQRDVPIPVFLSAAVQNNGGSVIALPTDATLLAKARWLRTISEGCNLVLLHHHPYDVVPVVAFARQSGPPVAIVNHADTLFWLGSSVSDAIINLRMPGQRISAARRGARHNALLPLPLTPVAPSHARDSARQRLNIPHDQLVVLSIGASLKYVPTRTRNFYETSARLLERNPGVHLYILGVPRQEALQHFKDVHHARLHLPGVIDDCSTYQSAADLYIEGFPFPSPTALLESVLRGVPPVLCFNPPSDLLSASDLALFDVIGNPRNESEYIDRATFLLTHPDERRELGSMLAQRVLSYHAGSIWRECAQELYRYVDTHSHQFAAIATSSSEATEDDLSVSEWHEARYRVAALRADITTWTRTWLLDTAYWIRQEGDYAAALRLLALSRRVVGGNRQIAWNAARLLPHWLFVNTRRAFTRRMTGGDINHPTA